jgi:predicted AlkP superfamily pyrophosphatase or phosphodiesterase
MGQKVIVLSADAMVHEDTAYLKTLPNYQKYLAGGAEIKRVRSIYPTITYPAHTTMATGAWPAKHGVFGNLDFHPGSPAPIPWHWFHHAVKCPDIFDAAKKAGLSTAGVFWPVTGNHPSIDYLIDEYWTQGPEDTLDRAFARAGSNEAVRKIINKNKNGYEGHERKHPEADEFVINCACDIVRQFKPDLLMIHPANIDSYRHSFGLFNDKVTRGIEETDDYIGRLMQAAGEAGVLQETNFFLVSDHGQIEIKRSVNINVLLADHGLIQLDEKGEVKSGDAYSLSGGMSALVFLRDRNDPALFRKTEGILRSLCEEGVYGIGQVFTEEEARKNEHFGGDFSFVLETDGYTSFGDSWKRPMIKNFDVTDYRYGRATHGYLPDKGPQPILMANGPAVRKGVVLEKGDLVDEAPTFAGILGLELPDAEGKAIEDILV